MNGDQQNDTFSEVMSGFSSKRGVRKVTAPNPSGLIALGSTPSSMTSSSKRVESGDDSSGRKRDFGSAFSSSGSSSSSSDFISSSASDSKYARLSEDEAISVANELTQLLSKQDLSLVVPKLTEVVKYVSADRISPHEVLLSSVLVAFKETSAQSTNLLESYPKLMKAVLDILVSFVSSISFVLRWNILGEMMKTA